MIKVMIVDDEYLLRSLIRHSIDWSSLGFEVAGEAEDGEAALKMAEEIKPQLMIVDINIPFINGLELSQIIHDKYPGIKIIILTGYEDFDYAKEAIKAGVLNYILKPIDEEEFRQALINAKNIILNESAQKKYISRLQQEAENGYATAKREFLNMLISSPGEERKEYFKEKIDYFDINITCRNTVVIVCEIDHFHEKWTDERDQQLWTFALNNIAEELFAEYGPSATFKGPQNHIVSIVDLCGAGDKSYHTVCNKILDAVKKYLDFTVTIGVGGSCHNYSGIYSSYQEAMKALEHKFFKGNDCIIEYTIVSENKGINDILVFEDKDKLLISLRTGERQSINEQIDSVFDEIIHKRIPRHYVQMTAMELASIAMEFAIENNLQITNILETEKDIFDIIKNKETVEEIKWWLKGFYQQMLDYLNKNKKSSTLLIVEKAKKYIELNYSQPYITLEEIAESIFVNPTYISNIFKKELGYSIIEYLTQYRLKKAKEIIDNGNSTQIIEIAHSVGYTDPYYFSKCFKKCYGLSPSKYMKKKLAFID